MNFRKVSNPARVIYGDVRELLKRQNYFENARPRSALLFLTFRCTSRCRGCSMWKRIIPDVPELDLDGWKRVANELLLNGIRVVELFGGDVFLRKDILIPFIRYLKELNITVHVPINGVLLDEEIAVALVHSGIDNIYLSIDGVGEVHDKARGISGNFERLVNGIGFLQKARGNRSRPSLICNTTIFNFNLDSLEEIIDFAFEAGFDVSALEYVGEITGGQIKHSPVNGVYPDPYFIRRGDSLLLNEDQARQLKRKVAHLVKKYSESRMTMYTLNVDNLSVRNLYEGTVPMKKCYQERIEVTVDPYGNVIVCPFFSKYILGNICREPLSAIWNNSKHLEFRSHQNSGSLEICRHCIMGVERSYGLRKGLERIFYKRLYEKFI